MRLGATVGAVWMLAAAWSAILPGRINWRPACAVRAWNAVREPGALFYHVECLDAQGTVTERCLHGMSRVVVVFLGDFLW